MFLSVSPVIRSLPRDGRVTLEVPEPEDSEPDDSDEESAF